MVASLVLNFVLTAIATFVLSTTTFSKVENNSIQMNVELKKKQSIEQLEQNNLGNSHRG